MKYREAYQFIGLCIGTMVDESCVPELASSLKKNQIDWRLIVKISSRQMVTPALFSCFRMHNLLEKLNPEIRRYLSIINSFNKERNMIILNQVCEVVSNLNTIGVQPILIKGAAHLSANLYIDPAARIMNDIDMIVPENQLMSCVNALAEAGYTARKQTETKLQGHHFPRLIHSDREAGVELHRWATSKNAINVTEILDDSQPLEIGGAIFSIPSREHALMINIIHSHSGTFKFPGQPNFRSFMDHALIQNAPGEKSDWARISFKLKKVHEKRAMKAFLDSMRWLMNLTSPYFLRSEPQLNFSRLIGKLYISGRYFERAINLTLFLISRIEIIVFAKPKRNEVILKLFDLKKWLNQGRVIKEMLKNS